MANTPVKRVLLKGAHVIDWGETGENNAVWLGCDMSEAIKAWPNGTAASAFRRADGKEYAHACVQDRNMVYIPLTATDTVAKSVSFEGRIRYAPSSSGAAPSAPEAGAIEQMQQLYADAAASASEAKSAASTVSSAAELIAQNAAIVRSLAPAIVLEDSGRQITVADSAEHPIQALSVYGSTVIKNQTFQHAAADGVSIAVRGKNLLPDVMSNQSLHGITLTANVDQSVTLNGTAAYTTVWRWPIDPALPAGTYTLSCISDKAMTGDILFMVNDEQGGQYAVYPGSSAVYQRTLTTSHKITEMQFTLMPGASAETATMFFQLEKGTTVTPYQAYGGSAVSVLHEGGIPGMPVVTGGSYEDENGQMWLSDEIDLRNGEYVQHVAAQVFDGNHAAPSAVGSSGAFALPLNTAAADTAYEDEQSMYLMCDRLPVLPRVQVAQGAQGAALMGGNLLLCVSGVTAAGDLLAWLQANPVSVLYVPRKEMNVRTILPEEIVAACLSLKSLKPVTLVHNSENLWQRFEYAADTKTYISNAVAAAVKLAMAEGNAEGG